MAAGMGAAMSLPAGAAVPMSGAEKLHRLDVMLKVSSARCTQSGSDLRSDYADFVRNHRYALGRASRELRVQLAQRYGEGGADHAYDRMNFELADEYRRSHPWLSCRDLKVAAHGLAAVEGSATLLEAADQILPDAASRHFAMLRRE
jgi:ElaB/YqjD/DUF883 family membrane-anchored ribosome-binding protein